MATIDVVRKLLELRCQVEALVCTREAMITANTDRVRGDFALAYHEESFDELRARFEKIGQEMREVSQHDGDWAA